MRVIAGSARGRRLKAPASASARPTGDKVKGAMFSVLEALAYRRGYEPSTEEGNERFAAGLAWPRVLDLYAGSGALGIEALSRGAAWADFVESSAAVRGTIKENLRLTGLVERAAVHALPADLAVSTLGRSYDLILADPPYTDVEAGRVLVNLAASPRVTDRSVLIWEHRADSDVPPRLGRFSLQRTLRHGRASVSLYTGELLDSE